MRSFLGLGANVDLISMSYANSAFDFDLDLATMVSRQYALNLDIDELNLQQWLGFDPGQFLDVNLNTMITLEAEAGLHLGFGFDLGDVFNPIFYVDADTGVYASVVGEAPDIDASLAIDIPAIGPIDLPPLGLYILNGSARVEIGAYVNLANPAADPDGDGRVSPGALGDAFQAEFFGNATADLPLFFPIKSLPLGGFERDRNGDGIGDNVLHADASFSVDENFAFSTEFNFALPNISLDFDAVQAFIAFIDNPRNMLAGIEGFFDAIDVVASGIDSIELPLIGGSAFDDLAGSLYGLRDSVLGKRIGLDYQENLGKWLQDEIRAGHTSVFDAVLDELRKALFNGFDALNRSLGLDPLTDTVEDALFAFVVPVYDEFGALTYDAAGKIITRLPTSYEDIELVLTPNGLITFNLKFGGVLVDGELPIDFNAGIPGVNLDIDAKLITRIDYLMGIGLGIGNMSNGGLPDIGVFMDTSGINLAGEEIALDVSARLEQGSTAEGTLGFLKMTFVDVNELGSGLTGHLGLDIRDANRDGRWEVGEGVDLALVASAFAEADFFARIETTAAQFLPSVTTTIHYRQLLGEIMLSTDGGLTIDIGSPSVILEDVTLDVGSLFDSFLLETLSGIYDIVGPLQPVVKLLLTEIPMGGIASPPIRFIDIARLKLPAKTVDIMTKVLLAIDSTIDFLKTVVELSDAGEINFGTFNLTEGSLKNPDADLNAADGAGDPNKPRDDSKLTADQKAKLKGPEQHGLDDETTTKSTATAAKKRAPTKNFSIPVLEDPLSLLDFVLGRGEVDLFWYDLPDLALEFEHEITYPVFPGLNVGIFGKIGAYTNFDFGYDTTGLSQWMATDFDPAESWRILNGFYLDDHGQENTAADAAELTLKATLGAVASLGIGGIVEAGVKGGIEAEIRFDLNDKETEILNDLPVGDGKFFGSEIIERIGEGPECLFDVAGELTVFLEAFLWIGIDLGFSTITLFEATERFVDEVIASFDWECVHDAPYDIAQFDSGTNTLTLSYKNESGSNYVPDGGGVAAHDYKVDVLLVDDKLTLETLLKSGYFDPDFTTRPEEQALSNQLAALRGSSEKEVIVVSNGLRVEVYKASEVDVLRTEGTLASDTYLLNLLDGRITSLNFSLGGGDDMV